MRIALGLVAASVIFLIARVVLVRVRDSRRLRDIQTLQDALARYFGDHHSYPVSFWAGSDDPSWLDDSHSLAMDLSPYIRHLPVDPINQTASGSNPGFYRYQYYSHEHGGSGKWYMLVFRLEVPSHDPHMRHGVRSCDGTHFDYGNGTDGIITVGADCVAGE